MIGGELDVMNQYQCQKCGSVIKAKEPFSIENDLFVKMKCKHCGEETLHLWVGENELDYYELFNVNVEPKYY